jgi:hypothetical protein
VIKTDPSLLAPLVTIKLVQAGREDGANARKSEAASENRSFFMTIDLGHEFNNYCRVIKIGKKM